MSSTQSFSLTLSNSNASTYLNADGATVGGSYVASVSAFRHGYANLNATANNALYPNATAHPLKADSTMTHSGLGVDRLEFAGTYVSSVADKNTKTETGLTISAITSSTKNTIIRYEIDASGAFGACRLTAATLTLYFTRYDFSAISGDGIASATVSRANGYDGDSVTFTAEVQNGYEFIGWYAGSTLVSTSQSYTHTVNGSDLQLTAISKRGGGTVIC